MSTVSEVSRVHPRVSGAANRRHRSSTPNRWDWFIPARARPPLPSAGQPAPASVHPRARGAAAGIRAATLPEPG